MKQGQLFFFFFYIGKCVGSVTTECYMSTAERILWTIDYVFALV